MSLLSSVTVRDHPEVRSPQRSKVQDLKQSNVRILIDYRPALHQPTGVGEHTRNLSRAIAAEGSYRDVSVTIFSSSLRHRLPPETLDNAHVVDRRIPVRCLNWLWHNVEWPSIELLAGQYDVVHSPHPLMIPSRHAACFVTIHDLYFLNHPDHTSAEIRSDYPALAEQHATRADGVIVPSRYTASLVNKQLGIPMERIILCANGAPTWTPRSTPAYKGHILFVGSIEPRKNLPTLLRAYRSLINHRPDTPELVLAGQISQAGLDELKELEVSSLNNKVRVLGYVSRDQCYKLYRRASMVVLPSLDEGFGLPALEAMTVGVPVVAANRGALPETVGDAGTLVDPEDENAIEASMARILDDRQYADRNVARGLIQAQAYNWDKSARILLAAYESAVRRRRGL